MKAMVGERPRVVVVDDERHIREMLTIGLEREGFDVKAAADGVEALAVVRESEPDVIILDVMLPKIDGVALLPMLRRLTEAPIVMLSAKGETTDKVEGLTHGADDYVSKPFEMSELVARLQSALRRPKLAQPTVLRCADLTVELESRTVERGRSEEHTSELQSHRDLHSFPTRRSSDLRAPPIGVAPPQACAADGPTVCRFDGRAREPYRRARRKEDRSLGPGVRSTHDAAAPPAPGLQPGSTPQSRVGYRARSRSGDGRYVYLLRPRQDRQRFRQEADPHGARRRIYVARGLTGVCIAADPPDDRVLRGRRVAVGRRCGRRDRLHPLDVRARDARQHQRRDRAISGDREAPRRG